MNVVATLADACERAHGPGRLLEGQAHPHGMEERLVIGDNHPHPCVNSFDASRILPLIWDRAKSAVGDFKAEESLLLVSSWCSLKTESGSHISTLLRILRAARRLKTAPVAWIASQCWKCVEFPASDAELSHSSQRGSPASVFARIRNPLYGHGLLHRGSLSSSSSVRLRRNSTRSA